MILYFANRGMDILGLASTELNEGFHISDDAKVEDINTGVAQFECTIHWTPESRALAQDCAQAGNYLLRSNNGENEFYTIIEVEEDTKDRTMYIYAEDAGMDLLNGMAGPFEGSSGMRAAEYVYIWVEGSGWEIGINEISTLTRQLEWTGEATIAERIASIATQFDNAEVGYSFEISGLVVTHKYINLYKQRGQDAGVTLRLNREVDRIVTTTSVADLATALYVTGGTVEGEEEPITLYGYKDEEDDGDIYTGEFDYCVRSKSALAEWARVNNWGGDSSIESVNDIVKFWSYDTTSQSELYHRAVTQLKKVYTPAVNYDVEITNGAEDVEIGDYVYIVDEGGGLYLQARVLQMQTSVCNETINLTLGDYVINSGGLSSQVNALTSQVSSLTANVSSSSGQILTGTITIGNSQALSDDGSDDGSTLVVTQSGLAKYTESGSGKSYVGFCGCTGSECIFGANTLDTTIQGSIIEIGGSADGIYIGRSAAAYANGPEQIMIEARRGTIDIGPHTYTINIGTRGMTSVYINGDEYSSSDKSLKTDIAPILEQRLDDITPVEFKWRDGDNTRHYGYIAQDVQAVMPELVKESDNGLLSLAYTEIIPLLHCKINEMEATVKSLEERIAKMEKETNHG